MVPNIWKAMKRLLRLSSDITADNLGASTTIQQEQGRTKLPVTLSTISRLFPQRLAQQQNHFRAGLEVSAGSVLGDGGDSCSSVWPSCINGKGLRGGDS